MQETHNSVVLQKENETVTSQVPFTGTRYSESTDRELFALSGRTNEETTKSSFSVDEQSGRPMAIPHVPELKNPIKMAPLVPTEPSPKKIHILCGNLVGRLGFRDFLEKEGYVVSESMFAECFSGNNSNNFSLVIVDMMTCQLTIPVLQDYLQEYFPDVPLIVIDEPQRHTEEEVNIMKEFAFSYVTIPCNRKDLLQQINFAFRYASVIHQNRLLRQSLGMPTYYPELYGTSPQCETRRRQIAAFAKLGGSILLTGENGSGKLMTAQQIHLSGPRAGKPFFVVPCNVYSPFTLDMMLFGYSKGSMSFFYNDERLGLFELANGGTIYFSHISQMPYPIQEKLSKYIKNGCYTKVGADRPTHVDVQVIAGSSKNLSVACLMNLFYEELYYQLNTQMIPLPSIKELTEDIPIFCRTLLTLYARFTHSQLLTISNDALQKLQRHLWSGNMNEFYKVFYRACIHAKNGVIVEKDIIFEDPVGSRERGSEYLGLAGMSVAEVERRLIIETLAANGGNRTVSARQLGISEKTIYNKSKQYKLKGVF
ncbi:MAG: sigma 54-interacting transcriptional regulator [Planctomycetaceae bacterium]|jgi:DNA-binding NtrC family response regulator|nr:sigma 54-interacting transcriptional regulator [Planctomycetaceae bacterium]